MNKIKILLVDDHQVLRRGLALLLGAQDNFEVVADVSKGEEAIELAESTDVDVLISDLSMPGMSGLELIQAFNRRFPEIPSMILSMHLDDHHIVDAVDAGAKGYLVKDSTEDAIIEAVETVAKGGMYLTPAVSDVLTKALLQGRQEEKIKESYKLTDREKEILQCIVDGLSNKMIADELVISERTVNAHRYNIMRKLKAHNTADLVRISINQKILV